jgi:hypothetical protein
VRLRKEAYRTRFGPWFVNGSVVYGRYASCMNNAVRRVTCARHPTIPGRCQEMEENQNSIYRMGGYRKWLRCMRYRAKGMFAQKPDPDTWRREWSEAPHPKRALRRGEMRAIRASGRAWHPTWIKNVDYKIKPLERAKQGKKPRAIGDLGIAASAKSGYIAGACKELFTEPFYFQNTRIRFLDSPNKNALRDIFRDMYSSSYTEFVFYSDDSMVAYTENGRRRWANIDISSCDGSNFEPIFETLRRIMTVAPEYAPDVEGTFQQLLSDLVIKNPENKKEFVVLKTLKRTLFSGSTLTTLVNNVANVMIAISMTNHLRTRGTLRDAVVDGAYAVGYDVTYDDCPNFERLQFLKHSPFMTSEGLEVNLNLGVILRTFGECDGDLPGKRRLGQVELSERFLSELVRSHKHSGFNPVFDAFRQRFVRKQKYNYKIVERSISQAPKYVSSDDLTQRYGCSAVEIEDFCMYIRRSKLGEWISHAVARRILHLDYGLL